MTRNLANAHRRPPAPGRRAPQRHQATRAASPWRLSAPSSARLGPFRPRQAIMPIPLNHHRVDSAPGSENFPQLNLLVAGNAANVDYSAPLVAAMKGKYDQISPGT